jgi:hypothetical protein
MKAIKLTALVVVVHALVLAGAARAQVPAPSGQTDPGQGGTEEPAPAPPPPEAPRVQQAVDSPPAAPHRALRQASTSESEDYGGRRRSAFLFMPFLGIHSFQNESARTDPGFRTGALLGGRIGEVVSINGEAALDVLNPSNVPAGVSVTAIQLHAALSPLVHARVEKLEFVAGPKLGLFAMSSTASGFGDTVDEFVRGWLVGFNLGLFGALTDNLSIGGRLSFDIEYADKVCVNVNNSGEQCQSVETDSSAKVLGLGVALLM